MHVCTIVLGNTASIASGNPLSPSTQAIRMSWTPLLELGDDLHPELRALGFLEPQAEHVAVTVHGDAQGEVAGAALHASALTDLEHQAVQEHDRIDVIERPRGPGPGVVHHGVSDAADQIPADLDAIELLQVRLRRNRPQVHLEGGRPLDIGRLSLGPGSAFDGGQRHCVRSRPLRSGGWWRSAQRTQAIAPSRHAAASSATRLARQREKDHQYVTQRRRSIRRGDRPMCRGFSRHGAPPEMNTAILGSRGFPSTYRGYETLAATSRPTAHSGGTSRQPPVSRAIGLRLIKATQPVRVEPGGDR